MWPAIDPFFVLVLVLAFAVTATSLMLVYEPWASHATGAKRSASVSQVKSGAPAPPGADGGDEDLRSTQP